MKMNKILIVCLLLLSGCGELKKAASAMTGEPSEYCYHGVVYLQFPSGATHAVNQAGLPLTCK